MSTAPDPARGTRIGRVRSSALIARPALQQIEDELEGRPLPSELAAIVRELHRAADPKNSVLGALKQLLTALAQATEWTQPDRDGGAACPLHEASALITDSAGMRLIWAARALDPQGESA